MQRHEYGLAAVLVLAAFFVGRETMHSNSYEYWRDEVRLQESIVRTQRQALLSCNQDCATVKRQLDLATENLQLAKARLDLKR